MGNVLSYSSEDEVVVVGGEGWGLYQDWVVVLGMIFGLGFVVLVLLLVVVLLELVRL